MVVWFDLASGHWIVSLQETWEQQHDHEVYCVTEWGYIAPKHHHISVTNAASGEFCYHCISFSAPWKMTLIQTENTNSVLASRANCLFDYIRLTTGFQCHCQPQLLIHGALEHEQGSLYLIISAYFCICEEGKCEAPIQHIRKRQTFRLQNFSSGTWPPF